MATDNNDLTATTYRRARHRVSLPHPHLSFVTKYRPPVFTDAMLTFTKNTMRGVCADLQAELVEFNSEANHMHLLVTCPPTLAISVLVQRLTGRTAHAALREYTGACVRTRTRGHLWSPSNFTVSYGGPPLSITNQYIDGQARPPLSRGPPADTRDGLTPH